MKPENPVNTLPPVVIALSLLILGVECVFQLADFGIIGGLRGPDWRFAAANEYGFTDGDWDRVWIRGDYSFDLLKKFVAYSFINLEFAQMAFCAALTLALGKFTAEFYGNLKVLAIYVLTAIVGAIAFGVLAKSGYRLLGGFTPVYGLIGAYTYALWLQLGKAGKNQIMAFRLIGFLLALQLVFGLIFHTGYGWIAELAAFFSGFGLSVLLAPGGWTTFLNRMRQRS